MKPTSLLLLAGLLVAPTLAQGTKSDLRVLLVGHDPQAPQVRAPQTASERTRALYRERTGAWEAFLNEHFDAVRVVHGEDYEVAMSDEVDVTLFDARPRPLEPAGPKPRYLPDNFSRPALLVGECSPTIGASLGLKFDWL